MRLTALDFELISASRRVVESALGVVPGERVVVCVDRARQDLGNALSEVAREIGGTPQVLVLEDIAERPVKRVPIELGEALRSAQASVLSTSIEDAETLMRVELVTLANELDLRHAHMVGVTRRSMVAGFTADPARILDATRAVRTRLRPDSRLRVRSAAGTDLEVRLEPKNRWVEQVGVIRPGRWENLPSGELLTSPADANGVFVCDACLGQSFGAAAGLLDRTPVRFEIEHGTVRAVRCMDSSLQRTIEEFLRREHHLDRVGLVILGTNIGILAPVGELLCDQNLPGLHLALGATFPDQTGASWTARSQLAITGASADVDLDGAPLLRSGRYLVI